MQVGEEVLTIMSDQLADMRKDASNLLQRLVKNMIEKGSDDGEITIKIAVRFIPEYVDDGISSTARRAVKPEFTHKITSQMKVQENEGGVNYDDMKELVFDEAQGCYTIRYIQGAQQMNMFEGDFGMMNVPDEEQPEQDTGYNGFYAANSAIPCSDDKKNIEEEPENAIQVDIVVEPEADGEAIDPDAEEFAAEYAEFESYGYDEPERVRKEAR